MKYDDAKKIVERIDGLGYLGNYANQEFVLKTAHPDLKEEDGRRRYRLAQKAYIEAIRTVQEVRQEEERRIINQIATERARKSLDAQLEVEQMRESGIPEELIPYTNAKPSFFEPFHSR